jgi:predicted CXXCH cytochrome family protein
MDGGADPEGPTMPEAREKTGRARTLLLLAGAFFLAAGCSVERHYEVLSFFFDGVPKPGEEKKSGPVSSQYFRDDGPLRVTKMDLFFHPPYQQNRCTSCHPREQSLALQRTSEQGLCTSSCHEGTWKEIGEQPFVHGPAGARSCTACHDPHESLHRGLLVEAVPKLCYSCHDRAEVLVDAVHMKAGDEKCLRCHAPHGGSNRYFLRDEAKPDSRG